MWCTIRSSGLQPYHTIKKINSILSFFVQIPSMRTHTFTFAELLPIQIPPLSPSLLLDIYPSLHVQFKVSLDVKTPSQ